MLKIFEIFVEKKKGYDTEALNLTKELRENLSLDLNLRVCNRYLVEGIDEDEFKDSIFKVFAEKNVDNAYFKLEEIDALEDYIAMELLPGQFDIRAQAAKDCLTLIYGKFDLNLRFTKVLIFNKKLKDDEKSLISSYLINPVDSRSANLEQSFNKEQKNLNMPKVYDGFINFSDEEINLFHKKLSLAMTTEDLKVIRDYFKSKNRNPNETEIKVLDTYWSDHCRHTTFNTELTEVEFEDENIVEKKSFDRYLALRDKLNRNSKPVTLMDMATIGARYLKKEGISKDIDTSDEINACSIIRKIRTQNGLEDYLIEFKNETHNHPTEIEPFGGAATCLGGAIRDPLSGRAFVYQAMRVTGAADPTEDRSRTLKGKLPQKNICTTALKGYSSYGNQIGLATGTVREIYHDGYKAKRMEVGAVIGSTPYDKVRRLKPLEGDLVVLLGGRTGRDGVGGATGSSKSHDTSSIETMGAEVQKGNAPTERKIQRLMRDNEAKYLIRKCNDFGAGGVAVAVGELADGLIIDLDKVPVKYDGLNSTETAVSESQERMAVVIDEKDLEKFFTILDRENIEGTVIAKVIKDEELIMKWRGETVVRLDRAFLDSAGAKAYQKVKVTNKNDISNDIYSNFNFEKEGNLEKKDIEKMMSSLNNQSQRALNENFDSSNGAGTLVIPFGGRYQDSESSYMASLIPLDKGVSLDASIMTFGFNPVLSEKDQYRGAYMAVVESIAKIAVSGSDIKNIRLSFQEYFEKLNKDDEKWGKPLKSLLGALDAQMDYKLPAIGGKDSMSGTFNSISVPPTLISFAVNTMRSEDLIVNTLIGDEEGTDLYLLKTEEKDDLPIVESFEENVEEIQRLNKEGTILSCDCSWKNIYMNLINMSLGNRIGFKLNDTLESEKINLTTSKPHYFLVEVKKGSKVNGIKIGETNSLNQIEDIKRIENNIVDLNGVKFTFKEINEILNSRLSKVYNICSDELNDSLEKIENKEIKENLKNISYTKRGVLKSKITVENPRVLITVFPGNNCEYDLERAFLKEGAKVKTFVLKNQNIESFNNSIEELTKLIKETNILVIPGGFSAGDEPEGSGKFIANVFRNPKIKNEVMDLLDNRDGLIIGICNGFQALIKLGLVPYGRIMEPNEEMPTLTYNLVGKHMDQMSRVRVASVKSPWMKYVNVGEVYSVPISHGEGRFMAKPEVIEELAENGQILTQYVDLTGNATYEAPFNPNGSSMAVEGITSFDGRILGKMGHNERWCSDIYKNYIDEFDMKIFKAGVDFFRSDN